MRHLCYLTGDSMHGMWRSVALRWVPLKRGTQIWPFNRTSLRKRSFSPLRLQLSNKAATAKKFRTAYILLSTSKKRRLWRARHRSRSSVCSPHPVTTERAAAKTLLSSTCIAAGNVSYPPRRRLRVTVQKWWGFRTSRSCEDIILKYATLDNTLLSCFYARKQLPLSARLSHRNNVCPSVRHTSESVKNGASYDYQIFTVSCLEDSNFRNRKALL